MSRVRLLSRVGIAVLIVGCFLAVRPSNAAPPITSPYRPSPNVHVALPPQAAGQAQHAATGPAAPSANMTYNGGPVEQSVAAYTIFWSPHSTISSGYRTLINRYFQDIGGSAFYNIVTQYYQLPGPAYMQNISTLGGTWIDTNPYPGGRGTSANPLSDADIENEVTRALSVNPSWAPVSLGKMYFVYTEPGVESCFDPTVGYPNLSCTQGVPSPPASQYCAYHSAFGTINQPVIYANMPYGETWPARCRGFNTSPNGDIAADGEISISSHEHFEAATDPLLNAWFDASGAENGDKCAYGYGPVFPDGRNLTLNGHPYIIQLEWSNANYDGVTASSGCVASLTCYNLVLIASPAAGGNPTGNPTSFGSCPAGEYTLNTPVTILPGTNSGYTFTGWTGDTDCTDSSVTMTASKSCTANFIAATTPTPSPTPTPTPSPTPTPTPTPSPTPTPTATPTPTPVPTPSPTPLDSDGDGVPDASDNCPDWANPTQALPSWLVPAGDSDCDGFPNSVAIGPPNALAAETFMGTDPTRHCASTPARNDEPLPDRWPVDFDDNQVANGSDLLMFAPVFGAISPNPPFNARFDLNNDGKINGSDFLVMAPFFGKTCAP